MQHHPKAHARTLTLGDFISQGMQEEEKEKAKNKCGNEAEKKHASIRKERKMERGSRNGEEA